MTRIYESDLEEHTIELLEEQGYKYLPLKEQEAERKSSEVLLKGRLEQAIDKFNPRVPSLAKTDVIRSLYNFSSQDLAENNQAFHHFLTDGINVEYQTGQDTIGDKVWLMDFENPLNNDLIICNQVAVREQNKSKRLDLVLYINGLPLVVIELKNPNDQQATVKKAFTQLKNYKMAIPTLFQYNGVLVASDGFDARAGSLTSPWPRFMAWKTVDGIREERVTVPQIETLIKGMLKPSVLLDLIKQFTVAGKMGYLINRRTRTFSDKDISEIAKIYYHWRKGGKGYKDVPGFCASVSMDEVAHLDFVLSQGRYVSIAEQEDDFDFMERF